MLSEFQNKYVIIRKMQIITTHINADFDALASCIGANKIYPDASIVLLGSQERPVKDIMILLKDRFGILEEKDVDLKDVKKLIIVETRRPERIGKFKNLIEDSNVDIHIYDHHQRMEGDIRGTVDIHSNTGSTTTYFVEKIKKSAIKIVPLEATILALGIYEDTGSFTFPNTTPIDIKACAFLLEKGANVSMIARYLRTELTEYELNILSKMLHSTHPYNINGIQIPISSVQVEKSLPDAALLTHKLLEIENFDTLFVIISSPSNIEIIGRSSNPSVDVGLILRFLGGGGHSTAASASIKNISLDRLNSKIIHLLKNSVRPPVVASDIMSMPVKTISENQTVSGARKIMIRLGMAGIPVIKNSTPVGIVNRSDMDKAFRHGLGKIPVKGCLSGKAVFIKANTPVSEIQHLMALHHTGRLLVGRNKKIEGIVTRSDVLGALHKGLIETTSYKKRKAPKEISVAGFLKTQIPGYVLMLLETIGEYARQNSIPVYAVGGMVRDIILKRKEFDIDLVVEGNAIKFAKHISRIKNGKITFHKAFGTATVLFPSGEKIDFATARKEYYEHPAALPKVKVSSLYQDIARRDFTINAMAIRIDGKEFKSLIDYYGGWEDIQKKRIKVLHSLSFVEDPTRIFRAVRLEKKLGFRIENHTRQLIERAVNMQIIGKLENQRIRDEIILIFEEEEPVKTIDRMYQLHELTFIHPSLKYKGKTRMLLNRLQKVLNIIDKTDIKLWRLYWAGLMMYMRKKNVADVTKKFVFSKEDSSIIINCREYVPVVSKKILSARLPHQIYDLLVNLPKEAIFLILALCNSRQRKKVVDFVNIYKNISIPLTGDDLKSFGLKPGPEYGKIFGLAKSLFLDGKIKTREQMLDWVRKGLQ